MILANGYMVAQAPNKLLLASAPVRKSAIEHPCFAAPRSKTLRDEQGRPYAREVGRYFERTNGEAQEWTFSAAPPETREKTRPFLVPRFTRPLSEWLNLLLDAGFVLERFGEPYPTDAAVRERPRLQNARVFALLLPVRARKPA